MNCSIQGCTRRRVARGWCQTHYEHWRTYGDPRPRRKPTTEERLRSRIKTSDRIFNGTPCLERMGSRLPSGYGYLSINDRKEYTHRLTWRIFRGEMPDGYHIDHLCENKACCNPEHLDPVPPAENARRATAKVTHCPQGHAYDEVNTRSSGGHRKCRACDRERHRASHAARGMAS